MHKSESYIDWLWNKEHDEERRLAIEEAAYDIRHERQMQDSQCSMSNADINRTFESCQSCNYCSDKIKKEYVKYYPKIRKEDK